MRRSPLTRLLFLLYLVSYPQRVINGCKALISNSRYFSMCGCSFCCRGHWKCTTHHSIWCLLSRLVLGCSGGICPHDVVHIPSSLRDAAKIHTMCFLETLILHSCTHLPFKYVKSPKGQQCIYNQFDRATR